MDFDYQKEDKLLQIRIKDEIDHHTTEKVRRRVDYEIQRYLPRKVIFNFDNVSFMDSAGIGLLVGRYKLISMLGGSIILKNVKENIKKILEMSGLLKIIEIEESQEKNIV